VPENCILTKNKIYINIYEKFKNEMGNKFLFNEKFGGSSESLSPICNCRDDNGRIL
jgi:hypothetical protein